MTEDLEFVRERYGLSLDRIKEIHTDKMEGFAEALKKYFCGAADFCLLLDETLQMAEDGRIQSAGEAELKKLNERLYLDILPEQYGHSFANPAVAVDAFGETVGQYLSLLIYEIRSCIPYAFEGLTEEMTIRFELFLEVYGLFASSLEETGSLPTEKHVEQIFYYFFSDYAEQERMLRFGQMVDPANGFAKSLIMNSDLEDLSYLYRFGECITENELETARHLNAMSEEEIAKMADTFTEGYRIGFQTTNKDISIKKTVNIRYFLGYERVIRRAIENFAAIGLDSVIYRAYPTLFCQGHSAFRNGFFGADPNKQYLYDHKDDDGLFLDKALISRRLEAVKSAGEAYKALAKEHGGPAVMEIFGEKPFSPEIKKQAVHLNGEQEKMVAAFQREAALLVNEYIPGEERSFTIISFPSPEIGEQYSAIFDETMKLNTLDYTLYQRIQQSLIDTLDLADHVHVLGMGDNHTDITVQLHTLQEPEKETNFENCVADVNIPVGEVFTSPVLKGTNGILHVTGVYLEGLFYKDLELQFTEGRVSSYSCKNFASEAENKKYIEENILFHHEGLPLGEFAIGTNTVAYVMARKFGIADKLPILIAEKTGPHFAVGDTCYSQEEDLETFNPDGKKIIARSNEISDLRKEDPAKAYFSCHTDITIPYDELGSLVAVEKSGVEHVIIEKGRFVTEGALELNKALDEWETSRK